MGYLLNKLGKLPDEGIKIELDNNLIYSIKVNNRHIEDIKLKFLNK